MPCYAGPGYNAAACAAVQTGWKDTAFRSQFPIGYSYSDFESCEIPQTPSSACLLGNSPVYAVDVTSANDVSYALQFAHQKNLRTVVKTTGHDFLGRSTGYGSLEIWMRNFRQGITVEPIYQPSVPCLGLGLNNPIPWSGSAISIRGGYSWSDVYPVAQASNVIVVGASCPDVSAIGGYLQGGGYSAATGVLGLSADNVLEATIALTDGSHVVASACSNPDIYAAIRGGGGGTYGVVTSAKLKAYPEAPITSVQLTMVPLTPNDTSLFIDVVSFLYQSAVLLGDQGIGGHAGWSIDNPSGTFGGTGAALHMSLIALAQPLAQVQALFNPVASALTYLNGTNLNIAVEYRQYPTYSAWFYDLGNVNAPPAGGIAVSSRLLGRTHLNDTAALRYMLHLAAGQPGEGVVASVSIVGGPGLAQAANPLSGANPAWRQASLLHVVGRQWASNATAAQVQDIHHDVTFVKGAAAAALAPDSAAYMNEGDANDPDYLRSFYGAQLSFLQQVKRRVDPDGVLYCPTCVGSEQWVTDGSGRICKP